jgi:hypothetical protein
MTLRTKLLTAAGFVVAVSGLLLAASWYYCISVKAQPSTDYTVQLRTAARDAFPSENAPLFPAFVDIVSEFPRLAAIYAATLPADVDIDVDAVLDGTTDESNRLRVEAVFEYLRTHGAFDTTAYLPQLEGALRDYDPSTPLIAVLMPEIGATRSMTRFQTMRLDKAIVANDVKAATAALRESLVASRILAQQGGMFDTVVSLAARQMLAKQITRRAVCGDLSPQLADALLVELLDDSRSYSLVRAVSSERLTVLDTLQHVYTDDGTGDGYAIVHEILRLRDPESNPSRWVNISGPFLAPRKVVESEVNAYFDRLTAAADLPFQQRMDLDLDPQRSLRDSINYIVLELLSMDLAKAARTRDQSEASYNAALIVCAAEVFRGRHGHYPATLADFKDLLPPSATKDTFANNAELLYIATDNGYSLWSTGTDGDHDQGLVAPYDVRAYLGEVQIDGDVCLISK